MSVVNPLFFWAIGALAVPLWLHLSRRRRFTDMEVGTLRFLREAVRTRNRRARFEEVLLMSLRCAAVVLLALVFLRPHFAGGIQEETAVTETVILLDASGSVSPAMARQVRSAAGDELKRATARGSVTLAQFADSVEAVSSVDDYESIPGAPTDLGAAMGWALDQFVLDGRSAGEVIVIGHWARSALPKVPPRVWPSTIGVRLLGIAPSNKPNWAVQSVSLLTPYVTDEMQLEVGLTLPKDAGREVVLRAEGLELTERVPDGHDRVTFSFRPPRDTVRGWVELAGDDPWEADNRRPFVARWEQPARVLLVDGAPGSTPFEGKAYFVEKALAASGAAHGKSRFQPEVVFGLEGRQGVSDLAGVSAVGLFGVDTLSVPVAEALARLVESGGGLFVSVDGGWNARSTAALESVGLFPGGLRLSGGVAVQQIAEWDREDPALEVFDGREGGDLRALPFRSGFEVAEVDGWRAIAKLENGQPIFLERDAIGEGAGRVIVSLHPMTREWSTLPREALFAPLVRQFFGELSQLEGDNLPVVDRTPGLAERRVPGYYDLPEGGIKVIAADTEESMVAAASEAEVRTAFGLPLADGAIAPELTNTDEPELGDQSRTREIWPWAVLLLIVCLVVENIVATNPPITGSTSPSL